MRSVSIFGLGLMGGSLAHDLAALGVRVLGDDASRPVLDSAMADGVISDSIPPEGEISGIVVLATAIDTSMALLDQIAPRLAPDAVVTDVGSTKLAILEKARSLGISDRFVGSHPLAGRHESGWVAARTGLYADAAVFVCSGPGASDEALRSVEELWTAVGSRVVPIDADEHDRQLAWVSHLPQILSTALAASLSEKAFARSDLGPGGRDMTRLAASSPEMWKAIARTNAGHLDEAVGQLQRALEAFRSALQSPDDTDLLHFFEAGNHWST